MGLWTHVFSRRWDVGGHGDFRLQDALGRFGESKLKFGEDMTV